jgi:hypothetical protein
MSSIAYPKAPATATTPSTRPARVTRTQVIVLVLLASLAWIASTTFLAAEKGAERRMTFDGVVKR